MYFNYDDTHSRVEQELYSLGVDYSAHQATKTIYNGQEFRSKLEAKWAAFFDLIGFKWEYEPKNDLFRGWLPDFAIWQEGQIVYCEVKPLWLGKFPTELAQNITKSEILSQSEIKVAILGNAAPLCLFSQKTGYKRSLGYISFGKYSNTKRDWIPYSVCNFYLIDALWKKAVDEIESIKRDNSRGLVQITEIAINAFYTPIEKFDIGR
jgi:hypothetical protein